MKTEFPVNSGNRILRVAGHRRGIPLYIGLNWFRVDYSLFRISANLFLVGCFIEFLI